MIKLNSTPKALFVECLNRALAFAGISTNICNLVVDILSIWRGFDGGLK